MSWCDSRMWISLSTGTILADEVGLGKTIEAGIVLAQKWAERKRTVLVIVPSSLRNQWSQELADKFFIPSEILEAKNFNVDIKNGRPNPFVRDAVVICSYHFARNKANLVSQVRWDRRPQPVTPNAQTQETV